jgi:hypothetical protein
MHAQPAQTDRRAHTLNDSEAVLRQVLLELEDLAPKREPADRARTQSQTLSILK